MGLTLVTPPATYPITLAEAKFQCRVTHDHEDDYITSLIAAATRHIENSCELALVTQTWKLTLDEFTDALELPRRPVQSVTSVKYYDADGAEQTISADDYTVDVASFRQWVVLNEASDWPTILDGVNAVSVTFVAGYTTIPDDLLLAVKLLVATWHKNREAVNVGNIVNTMPLAFDALCFPYRLISI